jgi:NAD(P)-dependent dehydrogenase (short-subunit alcohol dehydrogenase family)
VRNPIKERLAEDPERLFDLTGRVAVVTGAASGIGKATAVGLARFGADIAAADIDDGGLRETIEQVRSLGRRGLPVHCDTGHPDEIEAFFGEIDSTFGQVDILVNNVGIIVRKHPELLSLDDWNRVIQINLTGSFLCAQEAGRRMIEQGTGGCIINISSIAGCSALGRGNLAYSTTKGALNQLTRELAVEWAKYGIRVNAILPAQIRTSYLQQLINDPNFDSDSLIQRFLVGIPLDRLGEPEDLIGPIVFLASDAAAFVTGALIPVDGGNLALNAGGSKTW